MEVIIHSQNKISIKIENIYDFFNEYLELFISPSPSIFLYVSKKNYEIEFNIKENSFIGVNSFEKKSFAKAFIEYQFFCLVVSYDFFDRIIKVESMDALASKYKAFIFTKSVEDNVIWITKNDNLFFPALRSL